MEQVKELEIKTKAERKKSWKKAFEDSVDRRLADTKELELTKEEWEELGYKTDPSLREDPYCYTKEEWEEKIERSLSGEARKLSLEELQRLCGIRK